MVFSSMHNPYLDPGNWQQQIGSSSTTSGPAAGSNPQPPHGPGSIRPGSMADRARLANIPMPAAETALKCPRCDSTNTKFCYFNNYSLSQPRHFCKTCRRYWTRGGALRSVPVGGGCRRNKRSTTTKGGTTSKSDGQTGATSSPVVSTTTCSSSSAADVIGLPYSSLTLFSTTMPPNLHHHQLPPQFGSSSSSSSDNMGFNFYGLTNSSFSSSSAPDSMPFHIGTSFMPQTQQFPFFAPTPALEASPPQLFEGAAAPAYGGDQLRPRAPPGLITHLPPVKMEDHPQELNLSRQLLLGLNNNNNNSNNNSTNHHHHHHEHYWNTATGRNSSAANWTDLSGFIPSSTPTNNNPP